MTIFDILHLSMYLKVPFDVQKHLKRIPVCVCVKYARVWVWLHLFAVHLKLTQHCKSTIPHFFSF